MKNRRITLLDIGLDEKFDASMTFVQSMLQNINAGHPAPICDIDFVRSRDPWTVASAFTSTCDVLHVMAHSWSDEPVFSSSAGHTEVHMGKLGVWAHEQFGGGFSSSVIVADGCRTASGVWIEAVRDSLQGPVVYIGTKAMVGWHESTVFSSAFYGSLFRNKGKGVTVARQATESATRAIEAFEILTGKPCPYKVLELKPRRRRT